MEDIKTNLIDLDQVDLDKGSLPSTSVNILVGYKLNNFYLIRRQNYIQTNTSRSEVVKTIPDFSYFRHSTIMSFFMQNQVDVPLCFDKSASLFTKSFELPHLKFNNLLMRSGKSNLVNRTLTSVLLHYTSQTKPLNIDAEPIDWFSLMFISKYNIKFDYNTSGTLMLDEFYSLPNNRAIFCNNYKIKSNTFLLDTMLSYFKTYNPIFSFYVRKVDKNIRKNSRGKSGKYSLV